MDFDWRTDEDVFIHARYTFKGDGSDGIEGYAGVTYDLLRKLGNNGIQTPVRLVAGTPVGTVRMHEDGRFSTPSGKARFIPSPQPWPGYAAAVTAQRKKISLLDQQWAIQSHLANLLPPQAHSVLQRSLPYPLFRNECSRRQKFGHPIG